MSREDPQFKLRMPSDLRAQAEDAAKASGRSLNAELVARLEASFLALSATEKLIPAKRARELASMARVRIPEEVRNRALVAINRAVALGHSSTSVDLKDLRLDDGLSEEELDCIVSDINCELINAGYQVEWDGGAWIWIRF